jgi:hypothetical protein
MAYILYPESQGLEFSTPTPTKILIKNKSLQAVDAERISHASTIGAE